jgi:hypothetical protein
MERGKGDEEVKGEVSLAGYWIIRIVFWFSAFWIGEMSYWWIVVHLFPA